MAARESPQPFSVLGGPIHQLGRRLGLARGGTNTVLLGLALGWGVWLLVVALAAIEGLTNRLSSMALIGAHARLLLAIPLFFIGETWVVPRMAAFADTIRRSGVVPPTAWSAL